MFIEFYFFRKRNHFNQELIVGHKDKKSTEIKLDTNQNVPTIWTKFTAQFAVSRHIQLKTDNILLLLPRVSDNMSSYHNFKDFIKSLMLKQIKLVRIFFLLNLTLSF